MKQLNIEVSTPANDSLKSNLQTGNLKWLTGSYYTFWDMKILILINLNTAQNKMMNMFLSLKVHFSQTDFPPGQ